MYFIIFLFQEGIASVIKDNQYYEYSSKLAIHVNALFMSESSDLTSALESVKHIENNYKKAIKFTFQEQPELFNQDSRLL